MLFLTNINLDRPETFTETDRYWLTHGMIGDPQATDAYTVEELRAQGYRGLYDPKREQSENAGNSGITR